MREVTTKVYKYSELSETAQLFAYEQWKNDVGVYDTFQTVCEMIGSLRGFLGDIGIKLIDICLDDRTPSISIHDPIEMIHDDNPKFNVKYGYIFYHKLPHLKARRIAWWENNVLSHRRIKHGTHRYHRSNFIRTSLNNKPFNGWVDKPSHIEPCPYTGVCWDDDILTIVGDRFINHGDTIPEAMFHVAKSFKDSLESEEEYAESREEFENNHADDHEYLYDGRIYKGD